LGAGGKEIPGEDQYFKGLNLADIGSRSGTISEKQINVGEETKASAFV